MGGNIVAPLFAYGHGPATPAGSAPGGFFTGIAITGGAFYPSTGRFPAPYRGNYFFADVASKFIARLDLANSNAACVRERQRHADQEAVNPAPTGFRAFRMSP